MVCKDGANRTQKNMFYAEVKPVLAKLFAKVRIFLILPKKYVKNSKTHQTDNKNNDN